MPDTPARWVRAQSPEVPASAWSTCVRRVERHEIETGATELIGMVDGEARKCGAMRIYVLTPITVLPLVDGVMHDVFTDVAFLLPDGRYHRPKTSRSRQADRSTFVEEGF